MTGNGKAEGAGAAEPISVRIPEAVRMTGLSRSRLYQLMGAGEVEYVKVGSSTLVLVASLRSFIESRRSASTLSKVPSNS